MIPGQAQQFFEGAAASGGSFQIDRSLRFNSEDSSYLNRTPSSAGDRRTWTYSTWIKRSNLTAGDYVHIFGHYVSDYTLLVFKTGDNRLQFWTNGGAGPVLETSAVLRDPSAWYHIVLAVDTTQSTASDRAHIYINGVEASYDVDDRASQLTLNLETYINSTNVHEIGGNPAFTSTRYFNGYLAENHLVDGTQLAASDFGETDTNGVWQPKDCKNDLTYGTNGFYLKFADNSSVAALGTDSSGNSNTWSAYNFSVAATDYTSTATATLLGSSSWDPSYNTVSKVFDGSGDGLRTVAEVSNQGEKFSVTFSPAITLSNETVSVDTSSTYQGMFVTLDGVDQSRTSDSDSAVNTLTTAALTGSLSKITMDNGTDTSGRPASMLRIRIGGTVLLDTTVFDRDSVLDSPTNYAAGSGNNGGNYCTLNSVETGDYSTLSNGNLDQTGGATDYSGKRGTLSMTSGKWYWEVLVTNVVSEAPGPGIQATDVPNYESPVVTRRTYYTSGNKFDGSLSAYGDSFTTGDIIGVAFDADAGDLTFYKNGVSQGVAFSGLSAGPYSPLTADYNGSTSSHNFGQQSFSYTPPTDYLSLCTENLPTPGIANGSTANNAITYTGDATNGRAITGLGFSPDLVWIKARNQTDGHIWCDIVRGTDEIIKSNNTNAEFTATNSLTSFDSDGFTVGDNSTNAQSNQSGFTYVAWAWDGGSSTVSNSDGSVTANVRANASAGFSIAKWTPVSSASTVGHGLNAAPEFILTKDLDNAYGWICYHKNVGTGKYLELHSTNAAATLSSTFTTAPTSTVFDPGTLITSSSGYGEQIAYCWAPAEGYSAFGSYTGNGSNDGPFVFLNFRPRWVLIKCSSTTGDWFIHDSVRDPYNPVEEALRANLANATSTTGDRMQFLSNGFQITKSNLDMNGSGRTFIYAAFAEHPFKSARAR